MPCAEEKSVPVFFSDFMAARTACTIATQETREKTGCGVNRQQGTTEWIYILMIFAPICSASGYVNEGVRPPEITLTRTCRCCCVIICPSRSDRRKAYWLRCQRSHCGLKELLGLHAFDETNVCTSSRSKLQTSDSLVHAQDLRRIRSTDDNLLMQAC